jgi:hypothetical protein
LFGYRVDADRRLVPEPTEQAAIDRIKELRRTGLSLRAIARTVRRDCGVPFRHGRAPCADGLAASRWRRVHGLTATSHGR